MKHLEDSDVSFHEQSRLDWRGRLFEMNGQLYRAIPAKHAKFYSDILYSDLAARLFSLGLVPTRRAEFCIPGCPLVLAHDRIDFVSVWREWSPLMMRDAALMVCDLTLELITQGYGNIDVHPWNVLFDFSAPRFVDFTSIVQRDYMDRWVSEWLRLFRRCWVIPLTLMSMGRLELARDMNRALDVNEFADNLICKRFLRWFPLSYAISARRAGRDPAGFFREMRKYLESLTFRAAARDWSNCHRDTDHLYFADLEQGSSKVKVIADILQRLRPTTVIDFGCNKGSILAAGLGAKVVAIDSDEESVNNVYGESRRRALKILPLLMDFSLPTPRHGRQVEFPSAEERLRCEVGLLLDQIHHLVSSVGIGFGRIAELLSRYCTRYALVELGPSEDRLVGQRRAPDPGWYTLSNFEKEMKRYFDLSQIFEFDAPHKLLLFKKVP